jgi:hypothetical protein
MSSVIILLIVLVAAFIFLCYLFNQSRVELNSLTIAAVEARSEATASREKKSPASETESEHSSRAPQQKKSAPTMEPAVQAPAAVSYEYRDLLDETGENYVVPQWMANFFSSSDICHTLDHADKVVFIVKLADSRNAEDSLINLSAECDMSTQTIALKFCFGEGAAAETFRTKFYLFERGDLFELNRLVRQQDARIDILVRSAEYTLEYLGTLYTRVPHPVLAQLKNVLSKIPS